MLKLNASLANLKNKPFSLNDQEIQWVEETLQSMSLREKVGQLFCPIGSSDNKQDLEAFIKEFHPGGIMYRPNTGEIIQETHRLLQELSPVPLLISANLEAGGNGIATDGTYFGKQMQVAATDNEDMAYKLGLVAGREGRAAGCNWAFAPIVDIDMNYRNPITNVRTFGSDPIRVAQMSKAFIKGIHESGLAAAVKHFPGDGVDDRDQHLLSSVNSLSTEEWDQTFGMVYQEMIDSGAKSIMAGHIMLPEYSKKLLPGIEDEQIMPATLAPELLNGLLRGKLGFNGLIVTDATPMLGFTTSERREIAVPKAIASGCDMFLFNRNIKEDYEFMLKGIETGILTLERVDEAVTRVLALKASLGLHVQKEMGTLVAGEADLSVLQCEEHKDWARECADQSVTLVKDTQKLLPISADKYKRVRLYVLGDQEGGLKEGGSVTQPFIDSLENAGLQVELYNDKQVNFPELFMSVNDFKEKYDLIIYVANLETASNQTTVRINWQQPLNANAPWFVKDIPTLFISVANPYHLQDVPMVKTYINAYSSNEFVVEAIVDKILGKSEFKGKSPIDPFCGKWDTRF
ncbi:beta-hexosaminidase [Bacillus sp. AFS076308]|uniref:glycoside hydrolase family 3 protein n=1 Tax=unclassified Bacillus (in: firmicutes) TaxID=185979 RepID=UPI000BF368E4|nr:MULTISPECIES: glycoside hydrolase family 3 N-terminal domain-containing protein [unclassified Bacillus (in: firmicutes)]PFO06326.1 beta-hexosaminidase [Bacillus sp. AFS076308]PGV53809.1 beta-hexosaminidase [Bacillus sp. AFS037270]